MTRRRLYSRLLFLGSGSGYLRAPLFVSIFTRRQSSVRTLQIVLRHSFLTFFTSLQLSNKYILIDAPHTMSQLRKFNLNVWCYFFGAATRFVYTSISLTVMSLNAVSRYGLFYLWSLSWHFRYFRMPPQPLLVATRGLRFSFYDSCQVLSFPAHLTYNRWSLLSFRATQRAPIRLLTRLLGCVGGENLLRDTTRELMYLTPTPRQTRIQLIIRSRRATLLTVIWYMAVYLLLHLALSWYRAFIYRLALLTELRLV